MMIKQNTKRYFPHYISASRDPKIMSMRIDYKARGYGLFYLICEYLAEQGGVSILNTKLVAKAIGEDPRTISKFVMDCINIYKLFESDGDTFWSEDIKGHIEYMRDISQKNSKNAKLMKRNKSDNSLLNKDYIEINEENNVSDRLTVAEQPLNDRSAIKEINEKNIISIEHPSKTSNSSVVDEKTQIQGSMSNVHISEQEYSSLVNLLGITDTNNLIERLSLYKKSKGVHYKSDFAALKLWALNDKKSSKLKEVEHHFKPKTAVSIWDEEEVQG